MTIQNICITFLFLSIFACQRKIDNNTNTTKSPSKTAESASSSSDFKQQEALVRVYVCSRGCFQYLLQIGDADVPKHEDLFSPVGDLADDLKQDRLKVRFSGKLLDEWADIKRPSPTDAPVVDFRAKKLSVTEIVKVAE